MTIRNRLKISGLVPIVLLLLLSSYFLFTSYQNFEKANALKTVLKNNAVLNEGLVQIGKERGLTALYIGSDRKRFLNPLKKQRVAVDSAVKKLQRNLVVKSKTYLPFLLKNVHLLESAKYNLLLKNIKKLPAIRVKADSPKADFFDVFFDGYTKQIATPMVDNLLQTSHFALNTEIAGLINTLNKIDLAKENAGLERGFVSYFMVKKASMDFDEIALWDRFKTKANSFDPHEISDTSLLKKITKLYNNPKNKEMLMSLAETSSAIQTDVDNGDYAEDPTDWFTLQTKKISLLSKAQTIVASTLWDKSEAYLQEQILTLIISVLIWLLAFVLAFVGYSTTKDITNNIKELEDVLNKAVNEMKESDQYLLSDTAAIENVDLDTHEGTRTAYKFLEQLVESAKEDKQTALQANEAKSLFLANMSHEIRTPLNGIVGFTELLKTTDLKDEQREFLSIIDKSSENLLSIINNILDLSKVESNKVEIENIVFNTEEEFDSAIENYAVTAAEKNIDLNYYLDPTISNKLKGDPTKIKEILVNLMSNAIKFTNYGGTINVEIKRVKSDNGDRIRFSVQDNGIGMTKEQQSRIFTAFAQADISVTRKYGGTGLGLTLSGQFAELMGGKLEVESTKDKGSTFFFSLPLEELPTTETDLFNAFTSLNIAKYEQNQPSKLDSYLDSYFEYYGPQVKLFESVGELKELNEGNLYEDFWIDIDNAQQTILDALHNIKSSKLIIIANVTSREKVEQMGALQNNVLYKPVTRKKIREVLLRETTPETKEAVTETKETYFSAKALVVEDNVINQKLIRHVLEDSGLGVDIANNGLEAFEKRRNKDYDIIFMDIQMPVMDGMEATREILDYEEDEEVPHIPIIALTANALKGDRERFLLAGMDEYISKPLETSELVMVLNRFLKGKTTAKKEVGQAPKTENLDKPDLQEAEIEPEGTDDTIIEFDKAGKAKEKKILIAKRNLLEGRILARIIDNLGLKYDTLDDISKLEEEATSGKYDILLADRDLLPDELSHLEAGIAIIALSVGSKEKKEFKVTHGELITHAISGEILETIIKKYRG